MDRFAFPGLLFSMWRRATHYKQNIRKDRTKLSWQLSICDSSIHYRIYNNNHPNMVHLQIFTFYYRKELKRNWKEI